MSGDLVAGFDVFQSGVLWRRYAAANPKEAATLATYVTALGAGGTPAPPVLSTLTGRGLVGMLDALSPSQVDPLSAAKMAVWPSLPVYLSGDVAVASGATPYSTLGASTFDKTVYGPSGVRPGASDDHHLVLRDPVRGRETDFYNPTVTAGLISSSGGCSFPIDSPQEPVPGNANASRFPLARGLVTPADVASGVIAHPLVCSLPRAVIGGPCVFPANQAQPPNPTGAFALGQRFQFPASLDVAALGLPRLEALICTAIRDHGLYLRDIGEGLIAIYGLDAVNQGGNAAAWGSAGVTLPTKNSAGYPFAVQLAALPWDRLQVMLPPTAAPW